MIEPPAVPSKQPTKTSGIGPAECFGPKRHRLAVCKQSKLVINDKTQCDPVKSHVDPIRLPVAASAKKAPHALDAMVSTGMIAWFSAVLSENPDY